MLFRYRQELHLSWADTEATPRWRIERDLAYIGVANRAMAWHAAEADRERRKQEGIARYKASQGRG